MAKGDVDSAVDFCQKLDLAEKGKDAESARVLVQVFRLPVRRLIIKISFVNLTNSRIDFPRSFILLPRF